MPDINQEVIDRIANDVKGFGDNVAALQESTNKALAEMRSDIDAAKKGDKLDPLWAQKIDKFAAEVETKQLALEKGIEAVTKAVEQVEAVQKRPGAAWGDDDAAKEAKAAYEWHRAKLANEGNLKPGTKIEADVDKYGEYCGNFPSYLRARADSALPMDVRAVLQTGVDPDGGYLVPKTVSDRVIEKVYETSNLRSLATVETIAGKELEIARDEDEAGFGGWVGEHTAPSETGTPKLGLSKIVVHEMFAEPRATQNMLEDAGIDVEAWLGRKVGEKFGRIEAAAFFNGDGNNKPRGLLTYPAGGANGQVQRVASGNATAITADGIIDLVFELKDPYARNARFLMNCRTLRDVVKLKDGQGNYLWQMGDVKGGVPSTLLSYSIDRQEDMPAVAASSLSIAFGDFKAAYTIVDRLGLTTLRDNLTAKPYVKFYTRRRVGGDVVNFEAFKLLVTQAS